MEELDLKELFKMVWNKKIQVLIIIAIFLAIGFLCATKLIKPMYKSSATLVLVSSTNTDNNTITATDVTMNSKLVETYSKLIKSDRVLMKVAENLGEQPDKQRWEKNVSVKSVTNTELIEITVKNEDANRATQIANEITKVFTEEVQEIYNINNVQLVSEAHVPSKPSNVSNNQIIAIFGLIGFVVSIIYIIILNIFDTTVKSAEEIEENFGVTVLASIPKIDGKGGKK